MKTEKSHSEEQRTGREGRGDKRQVRVKAQNWLTGGQSLTRAHHIIVTELRTAPQGHHSVWDVKDNLLAQHTVVKMSMQSVNLMIFLMTVMVVYKQDVSNGCNNCVLFNSIKINNTNR